MGFKQIDRESWQREGQYTLFRSYERPHYAVTSRLSVTHLMARKADGISVYRACLYAIGTGLHAVPALCMRFRGEQVVQHDRLSLSMSAPNDKGSFTYVDVAYVSDFALFNADAARLIAAAAKGDDLNANVGAARDDMAYLSCMPWLDYTSLNNAMADREDCIPRVSWGKLVDHGDRWDMAMTLEVHHALVDGLHVGQFFDAVQTALDAI